MSELIEPTKSEWTFYDCGAGEGGYADAYIVSEYGDPVAASPRRQSRAQWEADARLIVQAKKLAEALLDVYHRHLEGEIELAPKPLARIGTVLNEAGYHVD